MFKVAIQASKFLGIKLLVSLIILFTSAQAQSQVSDFNPDVVTSFSFNNSSDPGDVYALALQDDGKIIITGNFNTVGGMTQQNIARVNANGDIDLSFNSSLERTGTPFGFALAVQPDGKIIVGGRFTTVGGATGFLRDNIVRLNTNGSVDPDFKPSISGDVNAVVIQDDGKIVIGGAFTTIGTVGIPGGVARRGLARLNADGSLDTSFGDLQLSAEVNEIAQQDDGKIVIVGNFVTVDGETRSRVARINTDGTLDTTFVDPQVNNEVNALAIQNDGRILIGGAFTGIGDRLVSRVARLESDGSRDDGFLQALPNFAVETIALQDDGRIVIGGSFGRAIARLLVNGSVDVDFETDVKNPSGPIVRSLLIQDDAKIVMGGRFAEVSPFKRNSVARLNTDGSVEGFIEEQCFALKAENGGAALICL